MSDFKLQPTQYIKPIVTGTPGIVTPGVQKAADNQGEREKSFADILSEQVKLNSNIHFSKHAINRVIQRNIDISDESMERLNEGVRLASEKGLEDALILVDQTAFIVNAKNNTVITTVNGSDLKGNVFSNIDGTVII